MMKKRYSCSVIFLVSLALLLFSGCAKKLVTRDEALPREAPVVAEKKPPAAPKAKDDTAAATRRRAEEDRAVRERAFEAQARKEEARARAKAERETAERQEAKAEREAAERQEAKAAARARVTFEFVDVYFDFDRYNLSDEARAVLDKDAEWLNNNRDATITIEGHCDERGTAEYNLALGERRASAAAKYLMDLGVDARRIKTISYGFERPADPRSNEEAWAKNRRVHIVVSGGR